MERPHDEAGQERARAAKVPRVDARHNRARILAAADAVFAEAGPTASTEEVARRAEVAVGTVFRHFPTKAALAEAVFVGRLTRLADEARQLAASGDPGGAFYGFFTTWARLSARKQAVAAALTNEGVDVQAAAAQGDYPRVRRELLAAVEVLLTRAQAAGAVRSDIGMPELNALLVGVARAVEHVSHDPAAQARTVATIIDGLRQPG